MIVITKLHVFVVKALFFYITIHVTYYSKIFIDKACDPYMLWIIQQWNT
jgi:hypothetical protein